MVLDSYTFPENPQNMDLIESKKSVASVVTFSGSAVFQWDATLEGVLVSLTWDNMSETMYNNLRTKYLSTDSVVFDPKTGTTYNVIVENLSGSYVQYGLDDIPHRKDIELILNIRSAI